MTQIMNRELLEANNSHPASLTERKLCAVWECYSEEKRENAQMNGEHCGTEETNNNDC